MWIGIVGTHILYKFCRARRRARTQRASVWFEAVETPKHTSHLCARTIRCMENQGDYSLGEGSGSGRFPSPGNAQNCGNPFEGLI